MQFTTPAVVPQYDFSITHSSCILALGSCFAENVGEKLLQARFNIDLNPLGVLFNPASIKNSLELLIEKKMFDKQQLFEHNGVWHSYAHHSRFSDVDANVCVRKINERIEAGNKNITNAQVLFLTFGTAYIYELVTNKQIVSNCHKMPAQLFNRRMLSVTEIIADYTQIITKIRNVNPNLKIIFTVSPVRHLNDGAPGNQLSKATLILAINQLLGIPNTYYFPAYEIMLDELRDYRFYASDMVHPSALAVDYIWEKFSRAFFSAQTIQLNSAIEKINTAKAHRPLTHNSNELQKFANSNIEKINLLIQQLPNINFQDDLEYWNKFSLIV